MIRRPPRSTPLYSSAASDVYKRQVERRCACVFCINNLFAYICLGHRCLPVLQYIDAFCVACGVSVRAFFTCSIIIAEYNVGLLSYAVVCRPAGAASVMPLLTCVCYAPGLLHADVEELHISCGAPGPSARSVCTAGSRGEWVCAHTVDSPTLSLSRVCVSGVRSVFTPPRLRAIAVPSPCFDRY